MAANIRSHAIVTLASFFIVAPLPAEHAVRMPPQVAMRPAPDRPIARPSFPAPELRTITSPRTEPHLGFEGRLEPVAVADEPQTLVARVTPEPRKPRNDEAEVPELPASIRAPAVLAAVDLALPRLPASQHPEPTFEEFPGAVAVAVPRLAANAKWRRIIEEKPARPHGVGCANNSAENCAGSPWSRWNELVRKISALEGEERLQAANEGINALLTYASDEEVYGVGDHWATLQESMGRGRGDCEDIAIAKMWLLNAAGVDLSSMRLVVLKDTLRNLDHAVLSVVENGHQFVLDNTAWKVGRADWMRGYRPIYALSSQQSWIYGMRVPSAPPLQIAQNAAPALPQ